MTRGTRTVGAVLGVGMLLLGVSACEGTAVGTVTNKIYEDRPGQVYLLEVQQADGQRVRVRVTPVEWRRCEQGQKYPACKRGKTPPALRKV